MQCDPIPTWVALSDAGVQNRQNQIMQNWFRRKELVSPPYDKCRIFAKQHLEFHAGDLIRSEHRQGRLNREARKSGASHGQSGSYAFTFSGGLRRRCPVVQFEEIALHSSVRSDGVCLARAEGASWWR